MNDRLKIFLLVLVIIQFSLIFYFHFFFPKVPITSADNDYVYHSSSYRDKVYSNSKKYSKSKYSNTKLPSSNTEKPSNTELSNKYPTSQDDLNNLPIKPTKPINEQINGNTVNNQNIQEPQDSQKPPKCSTTESYFPDPSIALGTFHNNLFEVKSNSQILPLDTANYIFMDNHLKYQLPTKHNVAFSSLFGTTKYVEDKDLQSLLLGAIKTFRDPKKGNWKGSIIIITDKPKFVRKLLHENKEFFNCNPKEYDDIPSVYMKPEDGDNSCKISVIYEPSDPDHPLKYKWIKSRMLHVLKHENELRIKDNLPILDYLFYRDVDIWSWADTQKMIDYLANNYHGEDVAIWTQPGSIFEGRGEILHGGIWMVHRELSFYWLRTWTNFMSMLALLGQWRDQVSLGMTAFTHEWKYKETRQVRNKIGFGLDICIMPFGELYPLDFTKRSEWTNGVFLHWTGRRVYKEDKAAFKECGDDINISKAKLLPYNKEDEDQPSADPDEGLLVNLRDENHHSVDIVYPTKKVTCKTKQVVQHIQQFLEPRRIFLIVPKLTDCAETIYFSPNIFCFVEEKVLPFKIMKSALRNRLDEYFQSVIPIHLSINKQWSNFISDTFLYIQDDFIPLQPANVLGDITNPHSPLFSTKATQSEKAFFNKIIEKQNIGDYIIGKSIISVNRKNVVDMMLKISKNMNQEGFPKFLRSIYESKNAPSNFFNILYYGFLSISKKVTDIELNTWKNIKFDNNNSKEIQVTRNISGKCLNLSFLKDMQCSGVKALILSE